MAVRRKKVAVPVIEEPVVANEVVTKKNKMGRWGWVGVAFALLCVYWWKTNTWPIVAVVGTSPIFRYTVNQELYKQGGKSVIDTIVTEKLVQNELNKGNVKVTNTEISNKLTEIKKNFATEAEFETALTERNMTLTELKKQITIQMGIEKLLSEKIEVTASDTAAFIKEMGSLMTSTTSADKEIEAKSILRDQKLQQEINTWIEGLRAKGKVWWIGKV